MNKGLKNLVNDLFNNCIVGKLSHVIPEIVRYDRHLESCPHVF